MGQSNRANKNSMQKTRCRARALQHDERRHIFFLTFQEEHSSLSTAQRVTSLSPTRLKSTHDVRCFHRIHTRSRQVVSARALAGQAASARSSGRRDHIFVLGRGSQWKKNSEQQQHRCRFVGSPRRSGRRDGHGAVDDDRTARSRNGRCSRSLQRQPRVGKRGREGLVLTLKKIPPKKKKRARRSSHSHPTFNRRKKTNQQQ